MGKADVQKETSPRQAKRGGAQKNRRGVEAPAGAEKNKKTLSLLFPAGLGKRKKHPFGKTKKSIRNARATEIAGTGIETSGRVHHD